MSDTKFYITENGITTEAKIKTKITCCGSKEDSDNCLNRKTNKIKKEEFQVVYVKKYCECSYFSKLLDLIKIKLAKRKIDKYMRQDLLVSNNRNYK